MQKLDQRVALTLGDRASLDDDAGIGARTPRTRVAAHFGLVICMLCWGILTPAIYVLLATWDPYTLAAARYVLAAPVMLALLRWREGPQPAWTRLPWARICLLGVIGIGGLATALTVGLAHCDPISGIIVQAAGPAISVFVARVFFAERLPRGIAVALVLAMMGAVLAMAPQLAGKTTAPSGGELLVVVSTVCWAWYSLASQRWLKGWSQLRITALTILTGAVTLVVVVLVAIAAGAAPIPSTGGPRAIALLLFVALASSCLGVTLWNVGVQRLGLAVAALYLNLSPIFAVLASLALGVVPSGLQLLGGVFVVTGVSQLWLWRPRAGS
jgi:drug/metabolite transporter (DMT)-like permease